MNKINSRTMKDNNKRVVMDCLRKCAPISRRDLAIKIGLTSATITNIVNMLIKDGVIIETGLASGDRGRRPILLDINSDAWNVLGISITYREIDVVLCNFKAEIKAIRKIPFEMEDTSETVISHIVEGVNEIMRQNQTEMESVVGIGLAVPGPIDYENGLIINPPNFPNWDRVEIKDIIFEKLGIPVYLDKESNAAALAEYYFGVASGHKTVFCLNIYEVGVGGGLLRTGNIFHGFRDSACEIGHMTLDINGKQCSCGNYGCLESLIKGSVLLDNAKTEATKYPDSALHAEINNDTLTLRTLFDIADNGDIAAGAVVEKAAQYVAVAIGNIISIYSPEMVILGGEIPLMSESFVDKISQFVKKRCYPQHCKDVQISISSIGSMASPLGAVALVLEGITKA